MLKYTSVLLASILLFSCASTIHKVSDIDPYLWLEEIESPEAINFAKKENEETLSKLKLEKNFEPIKNELTKIAYDKNRVPWAYPMQGMFYNFWQDKKSVRGVWRRTSFKEYQKNHPKWEVLLDLDILAKNENENWVWAGSRCLPPHYKLCLISLSRGGKDAEVVREFDLTKQQFVKNGFTLPEAKSNVSWRDQNSLYVATNEGAGTTTDSGYPRILKILKRNEQLKDAKPLFEIDQKDQSISAYVHYSFEDKKNYHFISHNLSFYQNETWYLEGNEKTLIPMPKDSEFLGVFKDYLLYSLKSDLITKNKTFKSGSVVALLITNLKDKSLTSLETLFEPTEKIFFQSLSTTKNYILLEVIDNILGKVKKVTFKGINQWHIENIELGKNGMSSVYSTQDENDDIILTYSDFVTPTTSFMGNVNSGSIKLTKLKTSPVRFNNKDIITEQKYSTSKDGTLIPYFIVYNKNLKRDGKNPTLLYGYGGFESSETPYYLGGFGKIWLEAGGVFVMANIRGGGEYGPSWHQAAVKENRQIVFDDFLSIAENLIDSKITSPKHLGIQGGSNGGLLVAGSFIQRPDLFNAVVCEVPLLDMFRYHTLLAGASWMDEYGNPDDPKMREVLSKYSPYQNVKKNVTYPEVYFFTSTKDDRVHPGHSRKMVAKMRELGHPLYYYENIEGGHGGVANIEQGILTSTLKYTYLWKKLK